MIPRIFLCSLAACYTRGRIKNVPGYAGETASPLLLLSHLLLTCRLLFLTLNTGRDRRSFQKVGEHGNAVQTSRRREEMRHASEPG